MGHLPHIVSSHTTLSFMMMVFSLSSIASLTTALSHNHPNYISFNGTNYSKVGDSFKIDGAFYSRQVHLIRNFGSNMVEITAVGAVGGFGNWNGMKEGGAPGKQNVLFDSIYSQLWIRQFLYIYIYIHLI